MLLFVAYDFEPRSIFTSQHCYFHLSKQSKYSSTTVYMVCTKHWPPAVCLFIVWIYKMSFVLFSHRINISVYMRRIAGKLEQESSTGHAILSQTCREYDFEGPSSPAKSCRVQIIISPSITDIPSSSWIPEIQFGFPAIPCVNKWVITLCVICTNNEQYRIGWIHFHNTKAIQYKGYPSLQMFMRLHLCKPLCWFSITRATVSECARTKNTSCHVLIKLLWNSKYPCLFVLVKMHIHHNYVSWNPHSALYKQLHCELKAFGCRRDQGN